MTRTDAQAVTRLIEALATGDRPGLAEVLDPGVRLRALLPKRDVDLTGPTEVAGEMFGWFAKVPRIVVEHAQVDTVGDLPHAAYRFSLLGMAPDRVVEQHAYYTVEHGAITAIRLICSGFRPAGAPGEHVAGTPARHAAGVPVVARRIDALGDGCATLTPRIAAALRGMASGEVLAVLTDDPSAPDGIAAWSRLTGHDLVATAADEAGTRYYLRHA
jgi:TusA-related sulfurtransferase